MKNSIINRQFRYSDKNATLVLIAVNALVFLLTTLNSSSLYYLSLVPAYVRFRHMYWQFFTYMFAHASIWHLLSNLFMLFVFGRIVEKAVGTKEFLLYYFTVGILCGVGSYLIYAFQGNYRVVLLGASGALYGVMFLFSVLFPTAVVFLFGILPVRAPIMVFLYFCLDFFGQFQVDGKAHATHLLGLLVGLVYIIVRMRMNPLKRWGLY